MRSVLSGLLRFLRDVRRLRLFGEVAGVAVLLLKVVFGGDPFWVALIEVAVMVLLLFDAVLTLTGLTDLPDILKTLYLILPPKTVITAIHLTTILSATTIYYAYLYSPKTAWIVSASTLLNLAVGFALVRYVPSSRVGWVYGFFRRFPLSGWVRRVIRRQTILLKLYPATYIEEQVSPIVVTVLIAPILTHATVVLAVMQTCLIPVFAVLTVMYWVLPIVLPLYVVKGMVMKRVRIKDELPWFLLSVLPAFAHGRYYVFDESILEEFETLRYEARRYRKYYEEFGADYVESIRRLLREAPPVDEYRAFLREYLSILSRPDPEVFRRWAFSWLNMVTNLMRVSIKSFIDGLGSRFGLLFTLGVVVISLLLVLVLIKPEVSLAMISGTGLFILLGGVFGGVLVYGSVPPAFKVGLPSTYVPIIVGVVAGVVASFFVGVLGFGVACVVGLGVYVLRGRYLVSVVTRCVDDVFRVVPSFTSYLEQGMSSDLALMNIYRDVSNDASYSPHFKSFLLKLMNAVTTYTPTEAIRKLRDEARQSQRPEDIFLRTFIGQLFIYTVATFRESVEREVAIMIEQVFRSLEEQWRSFRSMIGGLQFRGFVLALIMCFVLLFVPVIFFGLGGIKGLSGIVFPALPKTVAGTGLNMGKLLETVKPFIQTFTQVRALRTYMLATTAMTMLMMLLGFGVFMDFAEYGLTYPRWSFILSVLGLLLGCVVMFRIDALMTLLGLT